MPPPNPNAKRRLDVFGVAIIALLVGVPLAPIGLGAYYRYFSDPSPFAVPPPPPLSPLARSVQALDEKSAVALAEEFLIRERRVDLTWKDRTLVPDGNGRLFTLSGAHAAREVDPKRASFPVTMCFLRGAEGWLVWEGDAMGCEIAGEWAPPSVLPQSEREAILTRMRETANARSPLPGLPERCVGLPSLSAADVGYVDTFLMWPPPGISHRGPVALASGVISSCPKDQRPWAVAAGNCGLDAPWKVIVVFELEGGDDTAGPPWNMPGPIRGTVELLDVATQKALCRRKFAVPESNPGFRADQSAYRARAHEVLCAEIAALGGGTLPPLRAWNCRT